MIKGIGTDLVNVDRISQATAKHPNAFPERILCAQELKTYREHKRPENYLAKCFAAKEALVKALGTGFTKSISWQDIEVSHDDLGKPLVRLSNAALKEFNSISATQVHLSLSDEIPYVQAFVVIE